MHDSGLPQMEAERIGEFAMSVKVSHQPCRDYGRGWWCKFGDK